MSALHLCLDCGFGSASAFLWGALALGTPTANATLFMPLRRFRMIFNNPTAVSTPGQTAFLQFFILLWPFVLLQKGPGFPSRFQVPTNECCLFSPQVICQFTKFINRPLQCTDCECCRSFNRGSSSGQRSSRWHSPCRHSSHQRSSRWHSPCWHSSRCHNSCWCSLCWLRRAFAFAGAFIMEGRIHQPICLLHLLQIFFFDFFFVSLKLQVDKVSKARLPFPVPGIPVCWSWLVLVKTRSCFIHTED